jgi:hypothetical protein
MVKVWIGSVVAAVLASAGVVAARANAGDDAAPANCGSCPGPAVRCDATIECTGEGCIVRWTAPDGTPGEIELACIDGECKVVRCTPCGSGCCR